jgi:O-antigen ligase
MACSFLFFSGERRWKAWIAGAVAIITVSLLVGFTRSVWLGTFCGAVYLVWMWRRWLLLLIPLPIIALMLINPFDVRERVMSAVRPHGDTDSNEFRVICRRAGIAMIKAHPWFGLGPERVKAELKDWIPADVPRPLPAGWYGHLHNIYLHYAADRGIPTALALMWMLGKMLFDFILGLRRLGPEQTEARAVLHGAIAMMIGILVVGYYEVNLGDSEVLILFLAVVSCGYVALDHVRTDVVSPAVTVGAPNRV